MVAVSREHLATLKALAHAPYDRAEIEALLLARLQAGLPSWTASDSDNLRRSLALEAEGIFLHGETENENWNAAQMVNSRGLYLDTFGVELGLPRHTGESDDDYLFRLSNSSRYRTIGSLPSIEQMAVDFQPTIVDVQSITRINRQDVDTYSLKASHALLTTDEKTALLAYLNQRENKIAGVDIYVADPVLTPFTTQSPRIDVTIRHTADVAADLLGANARTALYNWLNSGQRLGHPVYRSAIAAAAFVPGVIDASVAVPAADLAAQNGTAYTCPSTTTDVIVRTVVL